MNHGAMAEKAGHFTSRPFINHLVGGTLLVPEEAGHPPVCTQSSTCTAAATAAGTLCPGQGTSRIARRHSERTSPECRDEHPQRVLACYVHPEPAARKPQRRQPPAAWEVHSAGLGLPTSSRPCSMRSSSPSTRGLSSSRRRPKSPVRICIGAHAQCSRCLQPPPPYAKPVVACRG